MPKEPASRIDTESQDRHYQKYISELTQIFEFTLQLMAHPIKTVLSRINEPNDKKRRDEAVYFFLAMWALWFVIYIPMFLWRGIKVGMVSGVFIVVELVTYTLIWIIYAFVLHAFLRGLRIRSNFQRTTLCYFYTAVVLPIYAILIYPRDIVKYKVIDRFGKPEILLHPTKFSQLHTEALQALERNWELAVLLSGILTSLLGIFVFVLLSVVLYRIYRTKKSWFVYIRCLFATFLLYLFISVTEGLLEPVYAQIEVLFSKSS